MPTNNAVNVNPTIGVDEHITHRGSSFLWAVFSIMAFTDLLVFIWMTRMPRGQRVFHQLCIIILTTASIAYFSMASNLGYTGVAVEFTGAGFPVGTLRQIWYVRYIDWFITTPCLLLTLVLGSGLPLSDIVALVFFDIVMIVTGLVSALVESRYKWGFFTFGCVAMFYIFWVLFGPARSSAGILGKGYKTTLTRSAFVLGFLWTLYPVAFGLNDGGNVTSPDSEMIFYGILDLLAKPVFTISHLYMLSKLDLTALQLSSGKFTSTAIPTGHNDVEKTGRHSYAAPTEATSAPAKKGFFSRRGQYDATTAPPVIEPTNTEGGHPRPSEATVVSR